MQINWIDTANLPDNMNLIKSIKNRLTKWIDPSYGRSLLIPRRSAGMVVNHDTALTYSAIWRAVNLISQTIGTLPWTLNQRTILANGDIERKRIFNNPMGNVLSSKANDEMSSQAWRETMVAWALTWGNAYSEIERDGSNRPVALWPLEPERVTVDRDEAGLLVYRVRNNGRADTILQARDMFHLHGLGFDGLTGYSVIGYASRTVGIGLATEQFGSSFFENGASFNGVFEHPEALGNEAIKHLRESLQDTHGGPYNSGKPLILEEGMKWSSTSIPPNDAQFIETRKFSVLEVARWYGVPPHKLMEMDQSTFNNIEHQSIEFVTDALMPWIKRLENEADIKFISPQSRARMFTKLNVKGLLRGDLKTRGEWYKTTMNLGVYSINEVRGFEDENPIGIDGDKRLVQLNQTTLEKIGEDEPEPLQQEEPIEELEEEEEEEEDISNKLKTIQVKLDGMLTPEKVAAIVEEAMRDITIPESMLKDNKEETPQYLVLVETMERVNKRELHRATDAIKRYDTRDELMKWMNKFYSQHKKYMVENMKTPLLAVSTSSSLNDYIDRHVESSRLAVLNAWDNELKAPEFMQPQERVKMLVGGSV